MSRKAQIAPEGCFFLFGSVFCHKCSNAPLIYINLPLFYKRIFIDTDNDPETGYRINDMGANYLVEIYGFENRVLSSNYYEYDVNYRTETQRDQHDWNAWSPMFEVDAAVNENELEAQLWVDELDIITGINPLVLVQTSDSRGNHDYSPVFSDAGALVTNVASKTNYNVNPSQNSEFLTLTLTNHGQEPIQVESIIFSHDSTATVSDIESAELYLDGTSIAQGTFDGSYLTFEIQDLFIETFKHLDLWLAVAGDAESGHVISLTLDEIGVDGGVSYTNERMLLPTSQRHQILR